MPLSSAAHTTVFRERLLGKEVLIGLLVKMPSPALVELAGYVGFDFVIIDTEHGSHAADSLENHLRAADAVSVPALVRVSSLDNGAIGRVLDAGAAGVIVPHVSSAEVAERAVLAAHYPPTGVRGLATSTRAGRHSTVTSTEHVRRSSQSTIVVAQIEEAEGVPHAADIAAVPHLDCVWIGPNDLSMSMNLPRAHPEVKGAEESIMRSVRESGRAALGVLAEGPEDAAALVRSGATVVIFAAPAVLATSLLRLSNEVRLAVADMAPVSSPSGDSDDLSTSANGFIVATVEQQEFE